MTFGWLRNDWRRTSPGRRGFIINDSLILTLSLLLHLPPIRFCISFFFSLSPTYSHSNARRWWWLISCQIDSVDWKTHSNLQFIEKRGSDRKSLNHRRTQPESINYSTTVFFSKNTNFFFPTPVCPRMFYWAIILLYSKLSLSFSFQDGWSEVGCRLQKSFVDSLPFHLLFFNPILSTIFYRRLFVLFSFFFSLSFPCFEQFYHFYCFYRSLLETRY